MTVFDFVVKAIIKLDKKVTPADISKEQKKQACRAAIDRNVGATDDAALDLLQGQQTPTSGGGGSGGGGVGGGSSSNDDDDDDSVSGAGAGAGGTGAGGTGGGGGGGGGGGVHTPVHHHLDPATLQQLVTTSVWKDTLRFKEHNDKHPTLPTYTIPKPGPQFVHGSCPAEAAFVPPQLVQDGTAFGMNTYTTSATGLRRDQRPLARVIHRLAMASKSKAHVSTDRKIPLLLFTCHHVLGA